ncbi:GAF and ANTAR domain-containing protein [Micromonospora sp. WMMD723]|uniref:GAF and ANTAR domain-containing protein n=1 Tax=Micromonospora sp. WMMD723 TaxID=3403465 RepID=UPI003CF9CDD1
MSHASPHDLADAYRQLLGLLSDSTGLDDFLHQVVMLAARVVTPAAACGLTVRRDGHPVTVTTSDAFAAEVDELQYGADEGPCLEALYQGRVVQVDDLAADGRWPRYGPHAVARGVTSSLSLPLQIDGQTVAALNLYSVRPASFVGAPREHAAAFAEQCAAALTLMLRHADQAAVQKQLGAAMASRSVIDQAMGVLMAQQRCSASEAFDLLRRASQHRNRKLRDVAADIIVNVTGTAPESPAPFRNPGA